VRRKIAALALQLESGRDTREPLRRAGELILTHQADLAPGATDLTIDGERIELNPELTAVENAQAYFARYRKAREAEQRVPELLEGAWRQAAHLADLGALVEVAEQMDAIRALRREVGAATGMASAEPRRRGRAPDTSPAGPYRRVRVAEHWEALVGASAAGNATVTFDLARPDDLWLHARGLPGAHVILRTNGAEVPTEVLERAAQLAAWHSSGRASGAVEVDVAPRRHVKKIPNGPPGLVRYSNERTVRVAPRS
jgi:predicted ribosome quality control (RQC) complex YloA/Tae2 family protein